MRSRSVLDARGTVVCRPATAGFPMRFGLMNNRPTIAREKKKEAPPAGQRGNAAEPIVTDEDIAADNRYAPPSGILTPVRAPVGDAQ